MEQGIGGVHHPLVQVLSQVGEHAGVVVLADEVATFTGVEEQVVERLAGDAASRPAGAR